MSETNGSESNVGLPPKTEVPRLTESEIKEAHKTEISHLTTELLQARNPTLTTEKGYEDLSAETEGEEKEPTINKIIENVMNDACSDQPLEEVMRRVKETYPSVKNVDDIAAIGRFYWDNGLKTVPERVLIVDDKFKERHVRRVADKKTLVFVDQEKREFGKDYIDLIQLSGESDVPVVPDVYLKAIGPKDKLKFRSLFLRGVGNVMVHMDMKPLKGNDASISVMASEDIVLLPGTKLLGGFAEEISFISINHTSVDLQTKGDVIQYPDTQIGIDGIRCQNYVQNGGEITNPHPAPGDEEKPMRIGCDGNYIINGGTQPEESSVQIEAINIQDNRKSSEKEVETLQDIRQEISSIVGETEGNELADDAGLDIEAQPTSPEDLQMIFDHLGDGFLNTDIRQANGAQTRGYDFPMITDIDDKRYTEFLTYASAAGWDVKHSDRIGQNMKIIVEKKTPQV